MSSLFTAAQALGISTSLISAGGIVALSLFDIPELQAQPVDRSLPSIRWLFSRGSHIFPQAAAIASASFAYAAYASLPENGRTISRILQTTPGFKVRGYMAAAILAIGIAPFTSFIMIPNNFALIENNEKLGGARSQASADAARQRGVEPGYRSALESVNGKGDGKELTDLSIPQTKTVRPPSESDDREVREMLSKFGRQNLVRGLLMAGGGLVGLLTALA